MYIEPVRKISVKLYVVDASCFNCNTYLMLYMYAVKNHIHEQSSFCYRFLICYRNPHIYLHITTYTYLYYNLYQNNQKKL